MNDSSKDEAAQFLLGEYMQRFRQEFSRDSLEQFGPPSLLFSFYYMYAMSRYSKRCQFTPQGIAAAIAHLASTMPGKEIVNTVVLSQMRCDDRDVLTVSVDNATDSDRRHVRKNIACLSSCMYCRASDKKLKHCTCCGVAVYCSEACHRADWARHRISSRAKFPDRFPRTGKDSLCRLLKRFEALDLKLATEPRFRTLLQARRAIGLLLDDWGGAMFLFLPCVEVVQLAPPVPE